MLKWKSISALCMWCKIRESFLKYQTWKLSTSPFKVFTTSVRLPLRFLWYLIVRKGSSVSSKGIECEIRNSYYRNSLENHLDRWTDSCLNRRYHVFPSNFKSSSFIIISIFNKNVDHSILWLPWELYFLFLPLELSIDLSPAQCQPIPYFIVRSGFALENCSSNLFSNFGCQVAFSSVE